jgi:hypothetical protein
VTNNCCTVDRPVSACGSLSCPTFLWEKYEGLSYQPLNQRNAPVCGLEKFVHSVIILLTSNVAVCSIKMLMSVSVFDRLVPNLVALILFAFILPWTGTGPLWNQLIKYHSNICKNTWWRNLLFIHNYFGLENMVSLTATLLF